jgi:RNA polymerase sigma-70 factor (ECF subfamily)
MPDRSAALLTVDDLLARARAGDRSAENDLFGKLHARILDVAKRRVSSADTARDLAQDVVQTALEKYREAAMPAGLLPWIFTILHHKVGNHLKKDRIRARTQGPPLHELDERRTIAWTVDEGAHHDLFDVLAKALQAMSAECRHVFRLLAGGALAEDVRRDFGDGPIGTTYSRISRCRERLHAAVAELERERR